jgi:hypothetical protein
MATKNDSQLDYFMDVVLRNYCRASEENDILYEEMTDLKECLMTLYQENADLRFRMKQAGIEAPPSNFIAPEEIADLEGLEISNA